MRQLSWIIRLAQYDLLICRSWQKSQSNWIKNWTPLWYREKWRGSLLKTSTSWKPEGTMFFCIALCSKKNSFNMLIISREAHVRLPAPRTMRWHICVFLSHSASTKLVYTLSSHGSSLQWLMMTQTYKPKYHNSLSIFLWSHVILQNCENSSQLSVIKIHVDLMPPRNTISKINVYCLFNKKMRLYWWKETW